MLLFPLFLSFILSASGRVSPITKSSFKRLIEKRQKNDIWILMFHTDSNFQSKKLHPKFLNASILAGGMFRFGVVDTKQQTLLTREFMLKNQPAIVIFHQNGHTEIEETIEEPEDIIHIASKYLTDHSKEIDETWFDFSKKKKPMAILFTKKKNTPVLWIGISHVFLKKNIKIGICRNESLFQKFGVDKDSIPQIIFYNQTYKYKYTKKYLFANVERTLTKFLDKTLKIESKDDIPDRIMPSDNFATECLGRTRVCILSTKKEEDEAYEEMYRVYKNMNYKWFKGTKENVPFEFLGENEIWAYNPKVDGFIKFDKVTGMGPILQKIYEANIEWTRKYDLINKNSEL